MSVEFDRGSPGKFDSRTLNRKTLNRWTGRRHTYVYNVICSGMHVPTCACIGVCVCVHASVKVRRADGVAQDSMM